MGISLTGIAGGVGGFMLGGPAGAAAGYSLGAGIDASSDAADAATAGATAAGAATQQATEQNIEFQQWLWGEQTALQEPYMAAGEQALGTVQEQLATGFQFDQTDPSYQFRLGEGQKAIESSAAARGMQLSGSNLKDLTRFSQDYASTEYGNAYNRWQSNLQNQFGLASLGQAAASGTAGQGAQMGSQVGSSILAGGQAQAQMQSELGGIRAASAMAPSNTLMDLGNMYISGGGTFGG